MKCLACGSALRRTATDLPLNVSDRSIVIVKSVPVLHGGGCTEYLLDDTAMARVDELLSRVDRSIELAIVPFRS